MEGGKKKSNLEEMSAALSVFSLSPHTATPLLLTYVDRRASIPAFCLQAAPWLLVACEQGEVLAPLKLLKQREAA